MFSFIISCIAVVVFAGLTAYDIQQIKKQEVKGEDNRQKAAVIWALALYLNLINMFLSFLNIFGGDE
jgi:uncharacterized protein